MLYDEVGAPCDSLVIPAFSTLFPPSSAFSGQFHVDFSGGCPEFKTGAYPAETADGRTVDIYTLYNLGGSPAGTLSSSFERVYLNEDGYDHREAGVSLFPPASLEHGVVGTSAVSVPTSKLTNCQGTRDSRNYAVDGFQVISKTAAVLNC